MKRSSYSGSTYSGSAYSGSAYSGSTYSGSTYSGSSSTCGDSAYFRRCTQCDGMKFKPDQKVEVVRTDGAMSPGYIVGKGWEGFDGPTYKACRTEPPAALRRAVSAAAPPSHPQRAISFRYLALHRMRCFGARCARRTRAAPLPPVTSLHVPVRPCTSLYVPCTGTAR